MLRCILLILAIVKVSVGFSDVGKWDLPLGGEYCDFTLAKSLFKDSIVKITIGCDNVDSNLTVSYRWDQSSCSPDYFHYFEKKSSSLITVANEGVYILSIAVLSTTKFNGTVHIEMVKDSSYLSAAIYPLLPFFGVMCAVYTVLCAAWLVVCGLQWRDLLRIQYWIGGVALLGMIESATYFNAEAYMFAEWVSVAKRALARMLASVGSRFATSCGYRGGRLESRLASVRSADVSSRQRHLLVGVCLACTHHAHTATEKDWKEVWMDEAYWHILFASVLTVIMVLWRPTNNNQRYAFTPLLDNADDEDDGTSVTEIEREAREPQENTNTLDSDLRWVEENIPTSTLPLLDSDEEIINTKFEVSKMHISQLVDSLAKFVKAFRRSRQGPTNLLSDNTRNFYKVFCGCSHLLPSFVEEHYAYAEQLFERMVMSEEHWVEIIPWSMSSTNVTSACLRHVPLNLPDSMLLMIRLSGSDRPQGLQSSWIMLDRGWLWSNSINCGTLSGALSISTAILRIVESLVADGIFNCFVDIYLSFVKYTIREIGLRTFFKSDRNPSMAKKSLEKWLLLLMFLLKKEGSSLRCDRRPYGSTTQASPSDGRYQLNVLGADDTYLPEQAYTVQLTRTDDESEFIAFVVSAEAELKQDPRNPRRLVAQNPGELRPQATGKYSDRCLYSVEQSSYNTKSSVELYWKAPATGRGCVTLRAMVAESQEIWFEDGAPLTVKLCEDMRQPDDVSPNINYECKVCDEAKYEVTFEGSWSRNIHPRLYPESDWLPRFSDLVGASHAADYVLWAPGNLASDGLKDLAEHANTSTLEAEIREKSANIETFPQDAVSRVQISSYDKNSPFYEMDMKDLRPFGRLHIKLIRTYPRECEESSEEEGGAPEVEEKKPEDNGSQEPDEPSRYQYPDIASDGRSSETPLEVDPNATEECPLTPWGEWSRCEGMCENGQLVGYKWRERFHLVDGIAVEKYDPNRFLSIYLSAGL
ncbi:hypothetical protein MSG28_006503 [Choristoneura fumiferana]|uniref:Uncharacterized protein n=2 Tax=Choristoneura fumiferana TaxID=7141 RepID=A0ACC0JFC4_CHOFU|nr:hypothetical protein MSG28_006503 [Choristoneura fumiferana]KAI8422748.1 hypothetical protein MSG28_006503 [Choristoneura fumiferana]